MPLPGRSEPGLLGQGEASLMPVWTASKMWEALILQLHYRVWTESSLFSYVGQRPPLDRSRPCPAKCPVCSSTYRYMRLNSSTIYLLIWIASVCASQWRTPAPSVTFLGRNRASCFIHLRFTSSVPSSVARKEASLFQRRACTYILLECQRYSVWHGFHCDVVSESPIDHRVCEHAASHYGQ